MEQPYSTLQLKNPVKNSDCSALQGKNGVAFFGGDGYSGGGGYNAPCNGGTDGGNGDCSDGGKGTGMDISTYPLIILSLGLEVVGCITPLVVCLEVVVEGF